MKKAFIIIGCVAVFAGCKEHDTPLVFSGTGTGTGTGTGAATDSTYVLPLSSIPPDSPHNVLVEEFTGQSCSNCPPAHALLESEQATGNVNVICLYYNGGPQTIPNNDAKYDFRTTIATDISSNIYGTVGELPSGGVDRVPVSGNILLTQGYWGAAISSQKLIRDSMNLAVTCSYNGSTATIQATVTYLYPVSTQQNLSIAIVEDTIYDLQEDGTRVDSSYLFTDVFRDMVTSGYQGDPVLSTVATKAAGTVYWRKYTYTLPTITTPTPATAQQIKPNHCRVIAFLTASGTGDGHVIQSTQTKFEP